MGRKIGIAILIIIIALALGVGGYMVLNKGKESNNNAADSSNSSNNNQEVNVSTDSRTLVVYFSAQGHTKDVAEQIASNLSADTFEITPAEGYTSDDLDWNDSDSRVSREHDNESQRDVELVQTTPDNWDQYDTILLGYPIWWGDAAWPVDNFVKDNDFSGKKVITFCTSASSSMGNSTESLQSLTDTGDWSAGQRFSQNASTNDIKQWTDSLSE